MKKMRKSNFFPNFTRLLLWPPYEQTRKICFFPFFFNFSILEIWPPYEQSRRLGLGACNPNQKLDLFFLLHAQQPLKMGKQKTEQPKDNSAVEEYRQLVEMKVRVNTPNPGI